MLTPLFCVLHTAEPRMDVVLDDDGTKRKIQLVWWKKEDQYTIPGNWFDQVQMEAQYQTDLKKTGKESL